MWLLQALLLFLRPGGITLIYNGTFCFNTPNKSYTIGTSTNLVGVIVVDIGIGVVVGGGVDVVAVQVVVIVVDVVVHVDDQGHDGHYQRHEVEGILTA